VLLQDLLVVKVQVEDDEGLQGVFAVQAVAEDSDYAAAEEEF
jgi:hypothetical protein